MFKKYASVFIISTLIVVGAFAFSAPKVSAQTTLWDVAQTQVASGQQASVISAVKNLAARFNISIPEWGIAGKYDAKKLSSSFLQNILSVLGLSSSRAQAQTAETFDITVTTVDPNFQPLGGKVSLYSHASASYIFLNAPAPKTATITSGNFQVSSTFGGLPVSKDPILLEKETKYVVNAATGVLETTLTPGVNSIFYFVFEPMTVTIKTTNLAGDSLAGQTFVFNHDKGDYDVSPWSPSGSTFLAANTGFRFQYGANFRGLLFNADVGAGALTKLEKDHTVTYIAKDGASTYSITSTPGVTEVLVKYEPINVTFETTDIEGKQIGGALALYNFEQGYFLPPGSPSGSIVEVANGANRWQIYATFNGVNFLADLGAGHKTTIVKGHTTQYTATLGPSSYELVTNADGSTRVRIKFDVAPKVTFSNNTTAENFIIYDDPVTTPQTPTLQPGQSASVSLSTGNYLLYLVNSGTIAFHFTIDSNILVQNAPGFPVVSPWASGVGTNTLNINGFQINIVNSTTAESFLVANSQGTIAIQTVPGTVQPGGTGVGNVLPATYNLFSSNPQTLLFPFTVDELGKIQNAPASFVLNNVTYFVTGNGTDTLTISATSPGPTVMDASGDPVASSPTTYTTVTDSVTEISTVTVHNTAGVTGGTFTITAAKEGDTVKFDTTGLSATAPAAGDAITVSLVPGTVTDAQNITMESKVGKWQVNERLGIGLLLREYPIPPGAKIEFKNYLVLDSSHKKIDFVTLDLSSSLENSPHSTFGYDSTLTSPNLALNALFEAGNVYLLSGMAYRAGINTVTGALEFGLENVGTGYEAEINRLPLEAGDKVTFNVPPGTSIKGDINNWHLENATVTTVPPNSSFKIEWKQLTGQTDFKWLSETGKEIDTISAPPGLILAATLAPVTTGLDVAFVQTDLLDTNLIAGAFTEAPLLKGPDTAIVSTLVEAKSTPKPTPPPPPASVSLTLNSTTNASPLLEKLKLARRDQQLYSGYKFEVSPSITAAGTNSSIRLASSNTTSDRLVKENYVVARFEKESGNLTDLYTKTDSVSTVQKLYPTTTVSAFDSQTLSDLKTIRVALSPTTLSGKYLFISYLDADNDGVPDADDACPNLFGQVAQGCPFGKEVSVIMHSIVKGGATTKSPVSGAAVRVVEVDKATPVADLYGNMASLFAGKFTSECRTGLDGIALCGIPAVPASASTDWFTIAKIVTGGKTVYTGQPNFQSSAGADNIIKDNLQVSCVFDGSGNLLSCSGGKRTQVTGSLLDIYDPAVIVVSQATEYIPFVYSTLDNYWDIVTKFTPPSGCTVDVPEISTTVDATTNGNGTQAAVFTLTCDTSALAQAKSLLTAQVGAAVSGAAKSASVTHGLKDCTKRNPAGKAVCVSKTASSVINVLKEVGKPAGGKGLSASLWSMVAEKYNNGPTNIAAKVIEVAKKNDIAIPEWGIAGSIDSRALSASVLNSLNW